MAAQLWLTVFEDPGTVWPPDLAETKWRVGLSESETLQGCNEKAPFRSSPVFPVCEGFTKPSLEDHTFFFYFLCFNQAFPAIARLAEQASAELRSGLLYTLGLSSLVVISPKEDLLADIEAIAGAAPFASEVWRVENGRIARVLHLGLPDAAPVDSSLIRVGPYDSLPLAARTTVDEFVSSIGLLLPKIAGHFPGERATFAQLVELVNELVREMNYAANPSGSPPNTLDEYSEDDFRKNPELGETILYQDTDRLIQINAALAYLSTQALSGAVPVLERRSIIRRYSLLGVGTAVLALTRIARAIEHAFSAGAVEDILEDGASKAAVLPGVAPVHDPSRWKEHSVDRWDTVQPRESYPKLPYFSGRLGFRESEYTISAALQSLAAGAGPEWSLLTLTHELVHGHVRNILSIILQSDPRRRPEEKLQEFYGRFAAHIDGRHIPSECLLDSLRSVIFIYCSLTLNHGSLTKAAHMSVARTESASVDFLMPQDAEHLRLLLEGELRNINEILVHVLDLHYFYQSVVAAYVPLIWRSWAILPQVRGDLRQYLLRTVLVAAASITGTPYLRFRQSRQHIREVLAPLAEHHWSGASTVRAAVNFLDDETQYETLFYPFRASLMLVDLAHHVLTSSIIRGRLNGGDRHLDLNPNDAAFDEWFAYTMPDGFVDHVVTAPTAYLADRLAKRLSMGESPSLEAETVLMFLACCSHPGEGGTP